MDEQYITQQLNRLLENGSSPAEIRHFLQSNGRQVTPEVADLLDQYQEMRRGDSRAKINARFVEGSGRPDRGTAEAAGLGFGNGMTFGALPYAGAAVDSLGGTSGRPNIWNSDMSVMDLLSRNTQMNQQRIGDAQSNHPYAYAGGEVGGMIAPFAGAMNMTARTAQGARAAIEGGEAIDSARAGRVFTRAHAEADGSFNPRTAEMLGQHRAEQNAAASFNPEVSQMLARERGMSPVAREDIPGLYERPYIQRDIEMGNNSPHLTNGQGERQVDQVLSDRMAGQMTSRTANRSNNIVAGDRQGTEFSPEMAAQIRRWAAERGEPDPFPRDMGFSPNPRFPR